MDEKDKSIVPTGNPQKGGLYQNHNNSESAQKISAILNKSNALLFESLGHKIDIHNLEQLTESTAQYFTFCSEHGIMPSMRRLANWYGYSYKRLYQLIDKQSPPGLTSTKSVTRLKTISNRQHSSMQLIIYLLCLS